MEINKFSPDSTSLCFWSAWKARKLQEAPQKNHIKSPVGKIDSRRAVAWCSQELGRRRVGRWGETGGEEWCCISWRQAGGRQIVATASVESAWGLGSVWLPTGCYRPTMLPMYGTPLDLWSLAVGVCAHELFLQHCCSWLGVVHCTKCEGYLGRRLFEVSYSAGKWRGFSDKANMAITWQIACVWFAH